MQARALSLAALGRSGLVELEFGLGGFELGVGGFELALAGPVFVDGEEVDVGVGDVNADDFDHDALAEDLFVVAGEFFDGGPDGAIICVGEVVNFINFYFRDDKGVAFGLGGDVKEGEGFVVFVDFVTGDFSLDDFGENAAHIIPFWRLF